MTKPTEAKIEAQARLAFDPPNLTQQMLLTKMLGNDLNKAADLAQQYGGTLGTLQQRRPEKTSGASNPWSDKYSGDAAQREAEKARLLRAIGTKACQSLAASAGYSVLGAKLTP
jgi:hypothetical protein